MQELSLNEACVFVDSIPLYGRSFENTNGIHQTFSGIGPGGSLLPGADGIWPVSALPRPGAQVTETSASITSFSYGMLVVSKFDSPSGYSSPLP